MKTLIKRLLQISVALIVLLIAAVIILPMVIDPNDYKAEIKQAVKEQTGRDLEITGDIKLKVVPSLAFSMGATSFSNSKAFKEESMITMEQLDIGLSLWGIFSGEIRDVKVNLVSPIIYLGKTKAGVSNWDDILQHQAAQKDTDQPQETEEVDADSGSSINLASLAGISLTNATIYWDDQSAGEKTVLKDLNLEVGAFTSGQPFDVELTSLVGEKGTEGKLGLETTVTLDLDGERYQLHDVIAKFAQKDIGEFELTANTDFNIGGKSLSVSDLVAKVEHKEFGELRLSAQTKFDMTAEVATISGITAKLKKDGQADLELKANTIIDLAKQTLDLNQLAIENGELSLSGNVKGKNILDEPEVTAAVNLKEMNLRKWLKNWGVELESRNPEAFKKFKGQLNVVAKVKDSQRINIKLTSAALDSTTIDGDVALFLPGSEKQDLGINAKLALGTINVDDYLPPASKTEAASNEPEGEPSEDEDIVVDLDFLQGLNVLAKLVIADLTVSGTDLNQVDANVVVKNGVLTSRLFIPETHQGKIEADVTATSSPSNKARQRVTVNAKIDKSAKASASQTGINIGLLQQSLLKEIFIAGMGKGTVKLDMRGASVNAFKKSLGGSFDLGIKDGQAMNVDFMSYIRQGVAVVQQLSGEPIGNFAAQETNQTNKIAASISGVIKNGIITTNDLNGLAPAMRLRGEGKINLVDMSMDYTTTLKLVETSKGQGGAAADQLAGLPIPVRCKGSFEKLSCKADYDDIAKEWLEKEKGKLKTKAKDKIEEKLLEKLGSEKTDQIKGVFDAFGF